MILQTMIFKVFFILSIFMLKIVHSEIESSELVIDLTDEKWDQIQKGQWLIGFFDRESDESKKLEEDWNVFANKLQDNNINVGRVWAPKNPGLHVRFLVTSSPKAFYVKNGVAHEVPKVSRHSLIELISGKKWDKLKPVGFLSNPFSIQMSIISNLFIHAVNLYNFEHSIVQKFTSVPSATDFAFGLTFIVVGTTLGLLFTCAFGLLQILLSESKEPEEKASDDKVKHKDEDESEPLEKKDASISEKKAVRKRK